jgi:catabolite repression protein CreC
VPSSSTLFLVSHADGTIVVYDKERDDGVFTPQEPAGRPQGVSMATTIPSEVGALQKEWDPTDTIFVTMPPWHPVMSANGLGKADKEKSAKNPVSHWRVSRRSILGRYFSIPNKVFLSLKLQISSFRPT